MTGTTKLTTLFGLLFGLKFLHITPTFTLDTHPFFPVDIFCN
jgi:hypothetical protein